MAGRNRRASSDRPHSPHSGEPGHAGRLLPWALLLALVVGAMVLLAWAGTTRIAGPARAAGAILQAERERPGVQQTTSGLLYEQLAAGDGARPAADDTVLVHYEGRLADGTVFDSSYQRGQPAVFGVSEVIPGWTEGLQLMTTGSRYRFTIPPELGYGARGAGGVIPPHAVLSFDVELLAIAPRD